MEKYREPTPSSQCIDLWGFGSVEKSDLIWGY
jgi:hypothetical protein